MEIIKAETVTKRYANHLALDNVSISVGEGKIFGLLGPNGAGKTTLIRIINQITGPDEGSVFFNGQKLEPKHKELIGYLPEERGLYKKMKVGEQALYLAQLKGMSKRDALKKLKYWFEKFEIISWWGRKVEELSKGMQQKIQFIVTILHEPKLLIFDEPFSGFDPINVNLLKEEILNLKKNGSSIIFSTHNMASVEELCDDIALINKSRKILDGNVREVRKQFKTNSYHFLLSSLNVPVEQIISGNYSLISNEMVDGNHSVSVRITDQSTPSALIQKIISSAEMISFNEIIPSMNDVFISQVEKDSNRSN